jgi:hypothetical protein
MDDDYDSYEVDAEQIMNQYREVVRLFSKSDRPEDKEIADATKRMLIRMELKK